MLRTMLVGALDSTLYILFQWIHKPNLHCICNQPSQSSGHLSLVRKARAQNDVVVASIFVNPTQFGPGEDLDRYPRPLDRDTQLLAELGVDHLLAPTSMYQPHHVTYVDPEVRTVRTL